MLVRTAYAEERLHLLRQLRAEAQGAPLVDVFRPAAETLRYRLGTSLADLKIPFQIGDLLRRITHAATVDAYLLMAHRQKPVLSRTEHDRLVVVDGFDPSALRALGFSPPSTVTREAVKRAFSDSTESHAGVDAGLVASFLGTERPGRQFTMAFHSVLTKAREEGALSDTGEPTLWLAALMLRALAERSYELTLNGPLGEPMARFVRAGVATLLYAAGALALRETGVTRDAGLPLLHMTPPPRAPDPTETRVALLACAGLGLLPFLGKRANVGQTGIQAYGVCFDRTPRRLEDTVAYLASGEDPETLTRDIAQSFLRNPEERRRAERAAALSSIRANARALARQLEFGRGPSVSFPFAPDGSLAQFLIGRESVEQIFANESRRRELAKAAREAARSVDSENARQRLEALSFAAREYREDEPAGWLGAAEARHHSAKAIVALAADTLLDRLAGQAGQLLLERTGQETEGGAEEYERGRLYLLSHEDRPLLAARMSAPRVGHLFVDVKDFTRRTAFLKENVIADFLQREFYSPILAAASGADPGARLPQMEHSITLNNLLGDALSFSGDIVALMKLAREIRAALRNYARRLEEEASQEAIAQRVRNLESTHRMRREAMERAIRELVARAPYADPVTADAMLARARQTRAELARQELLFRGELARATGERLEAGIFVSFGAAAEVATFEDPVFGPLKVAIAEKINESARGTARHAGVREKLEALRIRASRHAGRELEQPFAVFVETPPSLPVSAEQALAITELSARGEIQAAERMLMEIARSALVELQQQGQQGGKIYNAGAAVSEEALEAYLEARGDELRVLRRELAVEHMHRALRERFFFPAPKLSLIACLHPSSRSLRELFVYQGRAQFKGFEATGGLGVYEIIDSTEPFFQLLAQHHIPAWTGSELTCRSPNHAA